MSLVDELIEQKARGTAEDVYAAITLGALLKLARESGYRLRFVLRAGVVVRIEWVRR